MKKLFTLLTAILLMLGATRALAATFTWSQFDGSTYKAKYTATGMKIYRLTWSSENLYMNMSFDEEKAGSYNGDVMPEPGYYTISTSGSSGKKVSAYQSTWYGNNYTNSGYYSGGSYYKFYSGGLYVEEGSDGPHIYTSSNITTTPDGYNAASLSLQIGSSATYRTVGVTENDNSMGTASYEIKSGYVYTTVDGTYVKHWKNGSTYTLTATPTSDNYRFVEWRKGNTVISSYPNNVVDVVIDGNATYTAYFEWAHVPEAGTISATADHGTVTVNQPSTNGGTAVTLSVTADDGYFFTGWDDDNDGVIDNTDNPRTVYVDGTKAYVAKFVEGVTIDVQAAMTNNHGFGWGDCFYYWAKAYGYDIMIRGADELIYTENAYFGISEINTSSSFIKDHGTTVRFTAFDARFYNQGGKKVLEANAVGDNGKNYHLILRGVGVDGDDTTDDFDQTFTSGQTTITDKGNNIYWFKGQNGNGQTYSTTWCSHMYFKVDPTKCGTIPSGIYPISDTQQTGTAISTFSSDYQSYGSYYVQSYVYHVPVSGYAEVFNRDEDYYVTVDAYSSRGYSYNATYGTAPYSITVSGDANGTAGIVWHSTDCGDVAYGAGTQKFFANNSITLTATPNNSDYEFWRWSDEDESVETSAYGASRNVTVSGNLTLQAIFRVGTVKHTVTFKDYDGSTTLQTGDVEENTQPTIASDPTRADDVANNTAYTFIGWKSSVDNNVYATDNLPVATEDVIYTAQYEPYFLLLDDKADNNDPYYAALGDKKDEKLNVKYMRSFTKDTWAVFSLPFNYSFQNPDNNTFREQVYYLISAKYTSDGYLTLNCMPNTYRIEANKPYILIPKADIENPTFKGVKMQSVAHNYYTAPNTEGIGTGVEFRNTTERETLAKDQRVIYVKDNTLYYPNMTVDSWMRPFRGYFYLNIAEGQIQYSPARVRLVNEEGETIETLPEASEETSAEVKKYIENGILVIERAGVKYDAQGHKLN